MYFLLKQSQWVSNEQVCNMLCQKVVNTYKMKIQRNISDIAKQALGNNLIYKNQKWKIPIPQYYLNPPHPVKV